MQLIRTGEGTTAGAAETVAGDAPPPGGWTALIDDLLAGRWTSPTMGRIAPPAPYERIVTAECLDGGEVDLVAGLGMTGPFAAVADAETWDAMGARPGGAEAAGNGDADRDGASRCRFATVAALADRLKGAAEVIAIGSGAVNDLASFVTARDGRRYAVFGTTAPINGDTSTIASMTLESGLKVSLPAHGPLGFFVDLTVNAAAPGRLASAAFGDCLCRSVAQVDW